MAKQTINVPGFSKAGPYSHVVRSGGFLFVSGQIPLDPDTGLVITGDIAAASELVLANVKRILEFCGSGLHKVVKVTVYLTDIGDFGAMNGIYGRFFTADHPVRTTISVAALPANAQIEVEVIAEE